MALLADPITLFPALDTDSPPPAPQKKCSRTQTIAQQVNESRMRSAGRVVQQDESDPSVRQKKKKKITPPRMYPQASTSQHLIPEQRDNLLVDIFCLPRTARLSPCADNELRDQGAHDILVDDFQVIQKKAQRHGLWFTVTLNTTNSTLLPQLHEAIAAHVFEQGLMFPQGDREEDVTDLGSLPWQFVKMGKRQGGGAYTMRRDTSLFAAHINTKALQKLTACLNPGGGAVNHWAIINPRFGDLVGPIDVLGPHPFPTPSLQYRGHRCFGERFMQMATPTHGTEDELERAAIECGEFCPVDEERASSSRMPPTISSHTSSPSPSDQREISPESVGSNTPMDYPSPIRSVGAYDLEDQELEAQFDAYESSRFASRRSVEPIPPSPRYRTPSVEIIERDPMAGSFLPMEDAAITNLMRPIVTAAQHNPFATNYVNIHANTVEAGAQAVIAVLHHTYSAASVVDFVRPDGVTHCSIVGIEPTSFLDCRNTFRIAFAIGHAPERGVWGALPSVLERRPSMFCLHRDLYTIVANPRLSIRAERTSYFKAFGSFFALHILRTNRGVQQTSFALPLAMLLTSDDFIRLPLKYIRFFDLEAERQLLPWVRLTKDTAFPKGPRPENSSEETELLHMLYALNINPAHIEDNRSQDGHDAWSKRIFCKVLLNLDADEVWGHPDFEALKDGFNIPVRHGSQRFLSYFAPETILSLIATLYNPRLVEASAIIPCLRFEISGRERRRARTSTRDLFAQLFVRAIHRYLHGLGHPDHQLVRDFQMLTNGDIEREARNPHTRPHILISALTESTVRPRNDSNFTLKFIMEDPKDPAAEASCSKDVDAAAC
ncbi:hypothetical protein HWV62_17436 [Athelia sp. TMB]|nr:hypothetical protein HWV62_17436 [Athelia sp. TMB]